MFVLNHFSYGPDTDLVASHSSQYETLESAKSAMAHEYEKSKKLLGGNFMAERNDDLDDELDQRWAVLSDKTARIQSGLDCSWWEINEVVPKVQIRYELLSAVEEDISAVGIYDSLEQAQAAMREQFVAMLYYQGDDLNGWLEGKDDAGIYDMSARALDSTTKDWQNHDWQIVPLCCEGKCHIMS